MPAGVGLRRRRRGYARQGKDRGRRDAGDVGENDEQVGVEGLGQEAGGGVFVHDRFDTFELTQPLADDWGVRLLHRRPARRHPGPMSWP